MSLLQGTVSLKRYLALGPVPEPEDLLDGLAAAAFRPFLDGTEEVRTGWVDWRNPLIVPCEREWVMQDRYALFALRMDTRKVPAVLLKAHLDLRLRALQHEKDLAFVGREARAALQDEVREELLKQVLPVPKVMEVAWDLKGGLVWTTTTSSAAQSALMELFHTSFGIELQPLAPLLLAGRVAPEIPSDVLAALAPAELSLEGA